MERNYSATTWKGKSERDVLIRLCAMFVLIFIRLLIRDYRPISALDRYDGDVLDEEDYDAMSPGARAAAERELLRRDREEGTGRRDADDILYGLYYTYLSL